MIRMDRVETGVRVLDAALAGGFTPGVSILLVGEEGAGSTEFALAFLRHAAEGGGHVGRVVSTLRSASRVAVEYDALFDVHDHAKALEIQSIDAAKVRADPAAVLEGMRAGDVLLVESADALAASSEGLALAPCWRVMADQAGERGVVVLLLLSAGTLPHAVEAVLAEEADGVLRFAWHESGPSRRRTLTLVKLRGLAPALDGADVPVFEVALHRGVGFSLSRGRSVL